MKFIFTWFSIAAAALSLAACQSAPYGAYGSARLAPVKYVDPAHHIDDCVRVAFPQCSGGQ
jgi:hypothetical protein